VSRPSKTGSIFRFKGRTTWWIKYYRDGVPIRETSGSTERSRAERLLKSRLGDIQNDEWISPGDRKITIGKLWQSLLDDYRANDREYTERLEQRWQKRIKKHFGSMKAVSLTSDKLNRYTAWCREQGLSNATINRDMAALRRAFRLAIEDRKLVRAPKFRRLKESEPRQGFVEEPQYDRLAQAAGELWLRAMLATAYAFGFRSSELTGLRVHQVDLIDRTIRLSPTDTKNDEGKIVALTSDVYTLLQACVIGKQADDYVFSHQDGTPIGDFRKRWRTMTRKAGCPGLLFHDLRRSAVRNMVRRGIPEVVAMKISGHKTRSVFDRYNIVSESDLRDAARRIEQGKRDFAQRAALQATFDDSCETRQLNSSAVKPASGLN
jgi:integrase